MKLEAFFFFTAILSLLVSVTTAWVTIFYGGTLRMTRPTTIFVGYDAVPQNPPKVFIRSLLYSTSARGQMVETMYVEFFNRGKNTLFGY
jgi:hypothetical protein